MQLMVVLQKLQEAGLTLNQKNCEFSKSRVNFLGQIVDHEGVLQGCCHSASLNRRFLGMTNQLSKFSLHLAGKTKPLRDLLSNKNQ